MLVKNLFLNQILSMTYQNVRYVFKFFVHNNKRKSYEFIFITSPKANLCHFIVCVLNDVHFDVLPTGYVQKNF